MKKTFIILVLISLFVAGQAYAEDIPIRNIWEGKTRLMAREKSTGIPLWQSEVQVQKIEDNDQPAFQIFEEGARFSDNESNYASWNYESYFELEGDRLLPHQVKVIFRDESPPEMNISVNDITLEKHLPAIRENRVAIFGYGSWMDAGTADAVLRRFLTFDNASQAVIGAWEHGGRYSASPYQPAGIPGDPPLKQQWSEMIRFLDSNLKSKAKLR